MSTDAPEMRRTRLTAGDTEEASPTLNPNPILTPRERAVLALIVEGSSSRAVAAHLGISPRTVEYHRANIMQKLNARNIADVLRAVLLEKRV